MKYPTIVYKINELWASVYTKKTKSGLGKGPYESTMATLTTTSTGYNMELS